MEGPLPSICWCENISEETNIGLFLGNGWCGLALTVLMCGCGLQRIQQVDAGDNNIQMQEILQIYPDIYHQPFYQYISHHLSINYLAIFLPACHYPSYYSLFMNQVFLQSKKRLRCLYNFEYSSIQVQIPFNLPQRIMFPLICFPSSQPLVIQSHSGRLSFAHSISYKRKWLLFLVKCVFG